MTEIYLVVGKTGQWDEYREWPVHAWSRHEDAQAYVTLMEQQQINHNDFAKKLTVFRDEWTKNNPAPEMQSHLLKVPKKWPSGLRKSQATEQVLRELNDIKNHNESVWEQFGNVRNDWQNGLMAAETEYLQSIGIPQSLLDEYSEVGHISLTDNYYDIDTLELD